MNIKIDKRIFNDVYYPYLLDYSHRYEVYYGGRGSGKTKFIFQKLLVKGLSGKRRILCMMKTTSNIKQGIWKELMELLDEFKLITDKNLKINKTDMVVTLPNGTEFIFKGIDSEEKAKGLSNISDIYLDEANLFTQDDFIALNGSVRSRKYKNLQVILSFNPVSRSSWLFKYWGFSTGEIPSNTMILKTTYKDNKFLPSDYHDVVLLPIKETNPQLYEILANGLFQTTDRKVFHNYEVKKLDKNELIKNNDNLQTCIGLDWGWNDPTTVITSLVDIDTRTIYIVDEFYQKGLTNSDIARAIKEKGYHKNVIIADCANPKDIADLRKMGIGRIKRCFKGNNSILNGLRKLQEYKIIINEDCKNTIIEFDNYTWIKDKSSGEWTDTTIDSFNHCIDSLRYSIQAIRNKASILTVKL